jgi:transcriptional antiterminator
MEGGNQMQLTQREIDTTIELLSSPTSKTASELAALNKISPRTLKSDMANIRKWLKDEEVQLISKPSVGYFVEGDELTCKKLLNQLLATERLSAPVYAEMRKKQMMIQLLLFEKPISSTSFSDEYGVVKNTIIFDLQQIKSFFNENDIQLVANHLGFSVTGDERKRRLLLEKLIQENFTDYDLFMMMSKLSRFEKEETIHYFESILPPAFSIYYESVLKLIARHLSEQVIHSTPYFEIFTLALRLTISVVRLIEDCPIGNGEEKLDIAGQTGFTAALLSEVERIYHKPLLKAEYDYVYTDLNFQTSSVNVLDLTSRMIDFVTKEIQIPFNEDSVLFQNLAAHLTLSLERTHHYLNGYNPFLKEIKENELPLFTKVSQIVARELGMKIAQDESFISYITLHFMTAKERVGNGERKIRVVYICATGLGVTSFLQQKMSSEIDAIEIAGFASVLNYARIVAKTKPDLIISAFPVDSQEIPVLQVKPLTSEKDIQFIRKEVERLLAEGKGHLPTVKSRDIPKTQSFGELNQDTIVKGFMVYQALKELFREKLCPELSEGFLLHVLLTVHRIVFNEQYQEVSSALFSSHILKQIEDIFNQHELAINNSEVNAITEYLINEGERGL